MLMLTSWPWKREGWKGTKDRPTCSPPTHLAKRPLSYCSYWLSVLITASYHQSAKGVHQRTMSATQTKGGRAQGIGRQLSSANLLSPHRVALPCPGGVPCIGCLWPVVILYFLAEKGFRNLKFKIVSCLTEFIDEWNLHLKRDPYFLSALKSQRWRFSEQRVPLPFLSLKELAMGAVLLEHVLSEKIKIHSLYL